MEDYSLAYYFPMLPSVRQVISVDFGSGKRSDWPDAIHARLVDRSKNNGRCSGTGLLETASYISQNDPDNGTWDCDWEGYDSAIQKSEALELYGRLGYGYVVTGSMKEQLFLQKCGIHAVGFVDEGYLESHLREVYRNMGLSYLKEEFPTDYDLVNTCTSSHFRSWRLARLVEDYKLYFFQNSTQEQVLLTFKYMGRLKFPTTSM